MSRDLVIEDVPRYSRRMGEHVIQGSNNATFVLGTDRPAGVDSGLGHPGASGKGKGAGTAHIVVGRSNPDPSFESDSAFLYISAKTEVDKNLGIGKIEGVNATGPAFVGKSDHVRIVSRKDVKLTAGSGCYVFMSNDKIVNEANDIKLGKDADQKIIRGSFYRDTQRSLHQQLKINLKRAQGYMTAASAGLTAAGGDPVLASLASTAATNLIQAGQLINQAALALSDCSDAIESFENQGQKFLSNVSKTV